MVNEPLTKDEAGITAGEATALYEIALHSAKSTKGKIANAVILTAQTMKKKEASAVRLLRERIGEATLRTQVVPDKRKGKNGLQTLGNLISEVFGGVEGK